MSWFFYFFEYEIYYYYQKIIKVAFDSFVVVKYSIATIWDDEYLHQLRGIDSDEIIEIFACRTTNIVGHARIKSSVPNPSRKEAEEHIKVAKKLGFNFNYLLNASSVPYLSSLFEFKKKSELKGYLDWIVDQGIDTVTVADDKLMNFLSKHYPNLNVVVSIVAGTDSVDKVLHYRQYPNVIRINFANDLNKNIAKLSKLAYVSSFFGIGSEVLLNESCLYNCPYKKQHYNFVSEESTSKETFSDEAYHLRCLRDRLNFPFAIFLGGWIRPEDIHLYEGAGMGWGKIAGREMSADYLLRAAKAYASRNFEGELIDLLAINPLFKDKIQSIPNKNIELLMD